MKLSHKLKHVHVKCVGWARWGGREVPRLEQKHCGFASANSLGSQTCETHRSQIYSSKRERRARLRTSHRHRCYGKRTCTGRAVTSSSMRSNRSEVLRFSDQGQEDRDKMWDGLRCPLLPLCAAIITSWRWRGRGLERHPSRRRTIHILSWSRVRGLNEPS